MVAKRPQVFCHVHPSVWPGDRDTGPPQANGPPGSDRLTLAGFVEPAFRLGHGLDGEGPDRRLRRELHRNRMAQGDFRGEERVGGETGPFPSILNLDGSLAVKDETLFK